jgi:peptidoglycan/LPS O-acetylase OafA/YrhL
MQYRSDIDGLRAIAVVLVVLYHAKLGFSGGYVGVDVFFVISGFLLTSIIWAKLESGRFSFAEFWAKRVRRLIPALFVVTFVTAILGAWILLPEDLKDLGGALVAQPLMMVNLYFWRVAKGGYFGDDPEIRPMLHAWSLSLEEQFYLVFPIFLVLVARWKNKLKPFYGVSITGFASLLLCLFLTEWKPAFSFYNLPTRAWEFLLGAALSLSGSRARIANKQVSEFLALIGLAFIIYAGTFYHEWTIFPGSAALFPCVGAMLLIWSNSHSPTLVGRFLSSPPLVLVGKISYSLYLWHWPLMALSDYLGLMDDRVSAYFVVGLSFFFGYISWRWVEQPFRSQKHIGVRSSAFRICLVYLGVSLMAGALFLATNGLAWTWEKRYRTPLITKEDRSRTFVSDLGAPEPEVEFFGPEGGRSMFLLAGDSHAMSIASLFQQLALKYDVTGLQFTTNLSALKRDFAKGEASRWAELISSVVLEEEVRVVVFVGFWERYSAEDFRRLESLIRKLRRQGVKVVLVADIPRLNKNPDRMMRLSSRFAHAVPNLPKLATHSSRTSESRLSLDKISLETGAKILDPAPVVLKWDGVMPKGRMAYFDEDHLTDHGALLLEELFQSLFASLKAEADSKPKSDD